MTRSLGPDVDLLIDRHDDSVRSGSWSPVSTMTVRTGASYVSWRYGTQKEVSSPPLNARTMAMGLEHWDTNTKKALARMNQRLCKGDDAASNVS